LTSKQTDHPKDIVMSALPAELQSAVEVLRNMELEEGNILPQDQTEKVAQLSSLNEKLEGKAALAWDISTGDKADILFAKICIRLAGLSYTSDAISLFINEQLTPGKGLNYCNAAEVDEALAKMNVLNDNKS